MTLNSRTRPALGIAIPAFLAGLAGLFLLFAMPGNAANTDTNGSDVDNSGDVKIHELGSIGDPRNDPHVACPFYVEGFNMDAENGTLIIQSWPPTGNGTVVLDETWAKDDNETEGHHYLNGPYSLDSGHYKLFASDQQHDKMKVFWVDCDETTTTSSTSTSDTSTSDPSTSQTTASVPFFPTWSALALGLLGSIAGALLILRRRL